MKTHFPCVYFACGIGAAGVSGDSPIPAFPFGEVLGNLVTQQLGLLVTPLVYL